MHRIDRYCDVCGYLRPHVSSTGRGADGLPIRTVACTECGATSAAKPLPRFDQTDAIRAPLDPGSMAQPASRDLL